MTTEEFRIKYRGGTCIRRGAMSELYCLPSTGNGPQIIWRRVIKKDPAFDYAEGFRLQQSLNGFPYFPRLLDLAEDEEAVYAAEELIAGESIRRTFGGTPASPCREAELKHIFSSLCEAIFVMHRQTPYPVLHRDLKPSHVLITPDSRVVILDFGIACQTGGIPHAAGTRHFSAPEQFRRKPLTPAADLYALGAVMHETLTGKRPDRVPYGFPPAEQLNPALSGELSEILKKCLQAAPEARYSDAEQLRRELLSVPFFKDGAGTPYAQPNHGRQADEAEEDTEITEI